MRSLPSAFAMEEGVWILMDISNLSCSGLLRGMRLMGGRVMGRRASPCLEYSVGS